MRAALLALLCMLLVPACAPEPPPPECSCEDCDCGPPLPAPERAAARVGDAVDDAARTAGVAAAGVARDAALEVTEASAPAAIALADALQPEPPAPAAPPPAAPNEDPAIALMVRWEVTGQANYERKLQGLVCPPPPSGPTGGIGYDFGHQTRAEIRRVWGWHPDADRLASASGQIGALKCNAWRRANADIRIPWDDAIRVFAGDSLPRYRGMALRALPGLDRQTAGHIGGLSSTGYRRGWNMEGERMREKRVIRDQCVPQDSADCSAAQVIAMCRLWEGKPGGKGQCNRGADEARVIRS